MTFARPPTTMAPSCFNNFFGSNQSSLLDAAKLTDPSAVLEKISSGADKGLGKGAGKGSGNEHGRAARVRSFLV